MRFIQALLHHIWIIEVYWIDPEDHSYGRGWAIHRACNKARAGYRCHGRNLFRECI